MKVRSEDLNILEELEESLWRTETRFDYDYMNEILADDFFEFGRSGRVYSKSESLSAPMQEIHAQFPLEQFSVHLITDEVALVTYVSRVQYEVLEVANRSSLWSKKNDGWKLKFHQGTPMTL